MHPEKGMGVEFTQATPEHRAALEKFLGVLSGNRALSPELLVEPEGLEPLSSSARPQPAETDDPLLQLFYTEHQSVEEFHAALRLQRVGSMEEKLSAASGAPAPVTA